MNSKHQDAADCAPPSAEVAAPRRRLPPHSCDTHVHVFGPREHYPLDPRRSYTPHVCTLTQYRAVMRALGIERAVLVQPSVYGTDNRCLLDALQAGGAAFRGIAVASPDIDDAHLAGMHHAGVRGLRLNLVNPQVIGVEETVALCKRVAGRGWHLQIQVNLARDGLQQIARLEERVQLPLVIEHMGRSDAARAQPDLVALLRSGCWVKLSAPYRVSAMAAPHSDLEQLVRALVAAGPHRLSWGSDWPHTEQPRQTPQAAGWVDTLQAWLPDDGVRQRIFVDNPARLYGF